MEIGNLMHFVWYYNFYFKQQLEHTTTLAINATNGIFAILMDNVKFETNCRPAAFENQNGLY